MRYIGPPTMRETVDGIYNRMRQNYTRNNPLIAVANVKRLDYHDGVAEVVEDARSSDAFERNLVLLTGAVKGEERSPEAKGEANNALRNIARLSRSGFSDDCAAFYANLPDCVVLDPQTVFFLYFRNLFNSVDPSIDASGIDCGYEGVIAHELVHWDVGSTTPFIEMREAYGEVYHGKVCIRNRGGSKAMDVIESGRRLLKKIKDIEGKIGEAEKKGEKVPSRNKANLSRYTEDIEKCMRANILDDLCEDLEIDMLNEAVAYSIGRSGVGRMPFRKLSKKYGFNASDFRRAYEYFQHLKQESGTLEAIKRAKSVIEESWDSKRKVTDVLGLH